jgi:putative transposase
MGTIAQMGAVLGVAAVCAAVGIARTSYYRHLRPTLPRPRKASPRRLDDDEREVLLAILHEPRFADLAPAEVYATLLDEAATSAPSAPCIECSLRTAKSASGATNSVTRATPRLNSWPPAPINSGAGIFTKLLGPAKWTYYYLCVIIDVFSRYAVGWMVAHRETAALAERLIEETCSRQKIVAGQLTIHADRGTSMTSKPVALLLSVYRALLALYTKLPAGRCLRHVGREGGTPASGARLLGQAGCGTNARASGITTGAPGGRDPVDSRWFS